MKPFCNIGKSVLAKALGLQKNYVDVVETTYEVIDEEVSGCDSCRWKAIREAVSTGDELYKECEAACATCPNRTMKTEYSYKKVYLNERNRCGYKPRLKTNAIKLLLALHFYDIDRFGLIRSVDLTELARTIKCDIKTVYNNLNLLKDYQYISYTKTMPHCVNLYLPEYEDYFKPAASGGRGFLVLSRANFEELLHISSINTLRITIRQLMEFDRLGNVQEGRTLEKSYHDMRLYLPNYCKRNVIQKAASAVSMFATEIKNNLIKFVMRPEFNAKQQKEEQVHFYEQKLTSFYQDFAAEVEELNTYIHNPLESRYSGFFESVEPKEGEYRRFPLDSTDILDLAYLCLQYSYHVVLEALRTIYKTYVMKYKQIENLGGLVRTVINAMYKAA